MRIPSPAGVAGWSLACALASYTAAIGSVGYAMANSRTGMCVSVAVAAAAALIGIALAVSGFRGKYRPVRLTAASVGLLGSAAAGVLTLVLALSYRW
jgi:hypothetical protein